MQLSQIVNVQIIRRTRSITRAGFGTPLILTDEADFGDDLVRVYTDLDGVAEDFATGDLTYKAAMRLFGQDFKPERILVGVRSASVAQVETITVLNNNPAQFTVTLNGVAHTFIATAETIAQIRDALVGLINAGSQAGSLTAAAGSGGVITVTSDVAGSGFSVSTSANISKANVTPNNGVQEDIMAVDDVDSTWYTLLLTSRDRDDILNAAALIEAQRRTFIACSDDEDILTSADDDVLSELQARAYDRTLFIYSSDQASMPEAGLSGYVLPQAPGSYTPANKTIKGILAEALTATQEANIIAKNGNFITDIAGVNAFEDGRMVSGEWFDIIHGTDWHQADIEETVFARLHAEPKVPFTNAGGSVLEGLIRGCQIRAIRVGLLRNDPEPSVQVPRIEDVSEQDRIARVFSGITFDGYYAGAVHKVKINGSLAV